MQIAVSDQQALTLSFAEALRDAQVLEWGTALQSEPRISDTSEALQGRLKKTFDRDGLADFIGTMTHRAVITSGFEVEDSEVDIPLRDIEGFDDHVSWRRSS